MNKIAASLLAVASALFAFSSARAQDADSSLYAEIGYTPLSVKAQASGNTLKTSPSAVSGLVGYQLTPMVAVEGLLGLGLSKNGIKLNGSNTGLDAKLKNMLGVFVKPSMAVGDDVSLFARVGMVRTSMEVSSGGGTYSGTDLAYGVGGSVNLSKASYIQGSAMSYYQKNGVKVNGLTVGYGMRF